MGYKILALDIDGTLTNSKKQITGRTKDAITRAAKAGVIIALASGRPIYGIKEYAKRLDLAELGGYILSFNGGIIVKCATGEIIKDVKLPLEYLPEIYGLAKRYGVNLMSYDGSDVISENADDEYLEIEARINKLGIKQVDNLLAYINFPINKCLMLGEGGYLGEVEKKVQTALEGRVNAYRSEPYFLELLPKGVDKAESLKWLLERLGFIRDELMACGDGYNDRTMVRFAGLGVAMANARQEVKDVADYITLSNDEDGVADAIEKYILS